MNEIQESFRLAADRWRQQLYPLADAGRVLSQALRKTFEPQLEVLKVLQEAQAGAAQQMQQLQESLARVRGPLTGVNQVLRGLLPKTFLGNLEGLSSVFDEFRKRLDSQERRAFGLLAKRGWIGLEEYVTRATLFRLLLMDKSGKKDAFDLVVCKMFRKNRHKVLGEIVRAWWGVPYLRRRRKIVRQAVKAHKEGRFALSIPALLPLVDGMAVRIVGRAPDRKKKAIYVREAAEQYHSAERETWSECVLLVVKTLMYKNYDLEKKPPSRMNRHAIIHGEVIGYPTEANSLRVILLVDFFARLLRQKTGLPELGPRTHDLSRASN